MFPSSRFNGSYHHGPHTASTKAFTLKTLIIICFIHSGLITNGIKNSGDRQGLFFFDLPGSVFVLLVNGLNNKKPLCDNNRTEHLNTCVSSAANHSGASGSQPELAEGKVGEMRKTRE